MSRKSFRDGDDISWEVDRRYSPQVIERIARTLPGFVSEQARDLFPGDIRDWAAAYLLFQKMDDERDGNSDGERRARKELSSLAKAATALADVLENLSPRSVELVAHADDLPNIRPVRFIGSPPPDAIGTKLELAMTEVAVRRLQHLAEMAQSSLVAGPRPKRGHRSDRARRMAATSLIVRYMDSSGKQPTLVYNKIKGYGGKFYEFCLAAMTPVDGQQAKTGLGPLLHDVLYGKKKRRAE